MGGSGDAAAWGQFRTMQEPVAISFEGVSKSFGDGQVVALDRVSMAIRSREFLTLVGPSGSGKTTFLRLINRLADPTDGIVHVDGVDVCEADPIALRRRIGYVFQGVGLFPHLTVAENIAITPKLLRWSRSRMRARVDELLELVRLDSAKYRHRFPHELSGGERQRVGVARAIAAEPGIVLMDEPFGALDALTRDALGDDYRRLHDELGLTTVMITHDTSEAVFLADRIAVLRAGRIVTTGTPHDLMTAEHPYVRDLMQTPRRHAARLAGLMQRNAPDA